MQSIACDFDCFFLCVCTIRHIVLGKATFAARAYYGAYLGPLSQLHHGVSGDVFVVDSRTLFLKNFNYDGEGPGKF